MAASPVRVAVLLLTFLIFGPIVSLGAALGLVVGGYYLYRSIPGLLNPSYPFPVDVKVEDKWYERVGLDYMSCYRLRLSEERKQQLYEWDTLARMSYPAGAWTSDRKQIADGLGVARMVDGVLTSRGSLAPFERFATVDPSRVVGLAWTGPAVVNGTADDLVIMELESGSIVYALVHF